MIATVSRLIVIIQSALTVAKMTKLYASYQKRKRLVPRAGGARARHGWDSIDRYRQVSCTLTYRSAFCTVLAASRRQAVGPAGRGVPARQPGGVAGRGGEDRGAGQRPGPGRYLRPSVAALGCPHHRAARPQGHVLQVGPAHYTGSLPEQV